MIIPDNLKSGVTKPCYYEPDINPTYLGMALHYGTVIIPARVAKPKDKAKVETAVKIAEMWILAALRNHTFFSLEELNKAVAEKLIEFNNRKFKKMEGSRRSLFETIDKPALKPLPIQAYEYAEWKKAQVVWVLRTGKSALYVGRCPGLRFMPQPVSALVCRSKPYSESSCQSYYAISFRCNT